MSRLQITTNNRERELVAFHDLPAKVAARDYDYVTGEDRHSPRFVKYRGEWYDTGDMLSTRELQHCDGTADLARTWHAYQSDTYFSGIVVRYCNPYDDCVIIGRYYVASDCDD